MLQLSTEELSWLAGRRVIVVGGGKSAADGVLQLLQRSPADPPHVTWVSRRPYIFFKFERFFHTGTCGERARAAAAFIGFVTACVFSWLGMRLMWAIDYAWSVPAPGAVDTSEWQPSWEVVLSYSPHHTCSTYHARSTYYAHSSYRTCSTYHLTMFAPLSIPLHKGVTPSLTRLTTLLPRY